MGHLLGEIFQPLGDSFFPIHLHQDNIRKRIFMLADKFLGISGLAQQLQLGELIQNCTDFRTLDPGPKEY